MQRYDRDLTGYGPTPPHANWPNGAKIAVQFVLNYEEGGENSVAHGDAASEAFLSEIPGAQPWPGERHWNMESVYDYGARAGFWRVYRLFTSRGLPLTVYGVATALGRSPEQVAAMLAAEWEIASHGLKWIDYRSFSEDDERAHMEEAIRLHSAVTGARPRGWYTGRCSMNTVRLAAEQGFAYLSDDISDDLPYWRDIGGRDQLVVPYTMDANDMRFGSGFFHTGADFESYLKDSFDTLYAEGMKGAPKMMSVGLHCRLIGRPGRIAALRRFLDHIARFDGVWVARRIEIAEHWAREHPRIKSALRPSRMDRAAFVETFRSVFEHSPWIAERAFDTELGPAHDRATGIHAALTRAFREATEAERLGVLKAHPDLAGKLARARRLTAQSTAEQASAGLDALTDAERSAFTDLNDRYQTKFGFPFIIAVRDHDKNSVLAAFQRRLDNDRPAEFAEACHQVERIAHHRISDMYAR